MNLASRRAADTIAPGVWRAGTGLMDPAADFLRLFIQAFAVGFDDILVPVEGILFVAFQCTGAVIVAVYIDEAIPLFQLGFRRH